MESLLVGWKLTAKADRIELRNLEMLQKLLDKSGQVLSPEQASKLKNLDVALNIARVEKIHSESLRLGSTWRPLDLNFEQRKES